MHYKTMVHELLKSQTKLHNQLRKKRLLLAALNRYAAELKTRHEALMDQLWKTKPESDPNQVASEALEIALKELEDFFRSCSPTKDHELISLREGMEFIRRRTPHE